MLSTRLVSKSTFRFPCSIWAVFDVSRSMDEAVLRPMIIPMRSITAMDPSVAKSPYWLTVCTNPYASLMGVCVRTYQSGPCAFTVE